MLPPGHIAGGYLAGKVAAIWIPQLNQPEYLALCALFGFFPDLDFFYVFYKKRKFIADEKINHHEFVSHAPLLYLAVFLAWFALFPQTWLVATTFILGTWSHFVIDTITTDGIAWLYPFSKKRFGLSPDPEIPLVDRKFWDFWTDFVKQYSKLISFKLETAIIVIAFITLILSK
ncbi:MAG: metal-dependent hydrolase [Candidatus Doudnabacteria bacterium]